jgi:hypothetical protein
MPVRVSTYITRQIFGNIRCDIPLSTEVGTKFRQQVAVAQSV